MVKRIGQGQRELRKTYFREWREHRGLTQEQLAERLGTNKSAVSKLENGATLYNQTTLEAWAGALSVEPFERILRDPNEQPDVPIFDLPLGDKERVFEFIRALRISRIGPDGTPSPELADTPRAPAPVRSPRKRTAG